MRHKSLQLALLVAEDGGAQAALKRKDRSARRGQWRGRARIRVVPNSTKTESWCSGAAPSDAQDRHASERAALGEASRIGLLGVSLVCHLCVICVSLVCH